jgi:hypothetical protein
MNILYPKVGVASVCTALSFVLGASLEAKAATFNVAPTIGFEVYDLEANEYYYGGPHYFDGQGDVVFFTTNFYHVLRGTEGEVATLAEFNIGSTLPLAPNTVINSAVVQFVVSGLKWYGLGVEGTNPNNLGIFGYVGNGTAEASDFEAGVFLSSVNVSSSSAGDILNFDVTPFVNQQFSNGNAFAGFALRALDLGSLGLQQPTIDGFQPRLIVETTDVVEPVPEPTTIFGSAIALGVGGWLKRKKSSQPNKTKSPG